MPIQKSSQTWSVGEIVKVGFLKLRVDAIVPTPGDYRPDKYILSGITKAGVARYEFTPHHGLEKIE